MEPRHAHAHDKCSVATEAGPQEQSPVLLAVQGPAALLIPESLECPGKKGTHYQSKWF